MITLTTYDWVPDFAAPVMRAFRVRWALEEVGAPYKVRTVKLGPDQKSPEHLARQPFGQAPAIEQDGLVLFESGAIALWIAERDGTLLPTDPVDRARAVGWVFAALNSVEIFIQQLAEIDLFQGTEDWAKERRPQVEEAVRGRLAMLETALGRKDYLEGTFTVGDLMMVDVLRVLDYADVVKDFPVLGAYKERVQARPAFQTALAKQLDGFNSAE